MSATPRELRNAACQYADRGWHVVPLKAGVKEPATRHGLKDASSSLAQVLRWWQPNRVTLRAHNIGIVCNPSDLVVIDVDPRHGGDETILEAQRALGQLPQTVEAETGGGGWHYYFRHPGGTLRGQLGPGVDIKDHGYVVAPPSIHPSGRAYEWSVDGHPDEVPVADLPGRWTQALRVSGRPRAREHSPEPSADPLRRIPAASYVTRLSGREPNRSGFWQCPLHGGGQERTPSLKCDGHMWACYGCANNHGKRCAGGNILDFAGALWGFPVPLRGVDYLEVRHRLKQTFDV